MAISRSVRLFRHGRNQTVRIPVEFELPGHQAMIHREGDRLVIEPIRKPSPIDWLSTLEPFDIELGDGRDSLVPSRPVDV